MKAELAGKSTIIEMDANTKLGPEYIPNDPHTMSGNGKILSNIIKRHALVVANGANDCVGLITRQRSTTNRTERSCIDLVIFSSDLMKHFKHLLVDESRKHVLTRITKSKKGVVKKESDHNVLLTEFTCKIDATENRNKVEVYNIKNTECQKKFREYTSNTNMLSSIFNSEDNINILAQRFIKKLDGCIKSNFKKIRISKTKNSREEDLFNKLRELKEKEDDHSINEKEKISEKIAKIGEDKYAKVIEELDKMKPDEGKINSNKFWKLKKKLFPRSIDPPTAFFDKHGNLLTTSKSIEDRAIEAYSERLEPNQIKEHLESYENTVNKLCENRLKNTKGNKSEPWTMHDLTEALKDIDKGKSRDAIGHANEIFKEDVAGTDLKLALLLFMNRIKSEHIFPEALDVCNITSLYKHKGS